MPRGAYECALATADNGRCDCPDVLLEISSRCILAKKLVLGNPSCAAAPHRPPTTHVVSRSVAAVCASSASASVLTGANPFDTVFLSGAHGVAPEPGFRSATLDCEPERSRRKGNQSSGAHDTYRGGPGRSRSKCPARIRRYECRFDAAEAVQTPGATFPSGAGGSFQHLQPPGTISPRHEPIKKATNLGRTWHGQLPHSHQSA